MHSERKIALLSRHAKRVLVVFALCCALFICNGYAAWDYVTLMVDVDAELVYNNHVGDDWCNRYCVICNGTQYSCASGESMTVLYKIGWELEIYTYICEADDASSDVGSYSDYHSFSESDICDGNSCGWIHTVYVTENGGRYKGNTAQWDVTYTFYVKPTPTPRPTAKKTITHKPAETIKATPTPRPTNAPEATTTPVTWFKPTPEPDIDFLADADTVATTSDAENDGDGAAVLIFVILVGAISWLVFAYEEAEKRQKHQKKERERVRDIRESEPLHELPTSFRLVGYDEDKKTLFVVHIDDDEVIAVSNVSRREYNRMVWARERYYKRLLKRHKSKAVGRTDQ